MPVLPLLSAPVPPMIPFAVNVFALVTSNVPVFVTVIPRALAKFAVVCSVPLFSVSAPAALPRLPSLEMLTVPVPVITVPPV